MSGARKTRAPAGGTRTEGPAEPVLVRAIYERFPITIKGAFVLRGADPNPHTARIISAVIARIPSGPERPIAAPSTEMDVAPKRDLFLPFEASIGDLEPGWYEVRSRVRVDGSRLQEQSGKPFSVAWPRSAVRTGTIPVGKDLRVERRTISVDRVELRTDRAEVHWRADDPPGAGTAPELRLSAGRAALPALPPTAAGGADARGGRRRAVFYPVPRGATSLVLEISVGGRGTKHLTLPLS